MSITEYCLRSKLETITFKKLNRGDLTIAVIIPLLNIAGVFSVLCIVHSMCWYVSCLIFVSSILDAEHLSDINHSCLKIIH